MEHERFRNRAAHAGEVTAAQSGQMATVLSDPPEGEDVLTALGLDFDAPLAAGGTIR